MSQFASGPVDTMPQSGSITNVPYIAGLRESAETSAIKSRILLELERRRGERTYSDFAQELGISRSMLRCLELENDRPGLDTLAALATWSEDFEPLVMDYIRAHGKNLRQKQTKL